MQHFTNTCIRKGRAPPPPICTTNKLKPVELDCIKQAQRLAALLAQAATVGSMMLQLHALVGHIPVAVPAVPAKAQYLNIAA